LIRTNGKTAKDYVTIQVLLASTFGEISANNFTEFFPFGS